MKTSLLLSTLLTVVLSLSAAAKPLKVYILAGQSNMEGHAQTKTFPAVAKDPKSAHLHKKMVGTDGEALVHDGVHIAYAYGDFGGNPVGRKSGPGAPRAAGAPVFGACLGRMRSICPK